MCFQSRLNHQHLLADRRLCHVPTRASAGVANRSLLCLAVGSLTFGLNGYASLLASLWRQPSGLSAHCEARPSIGGSVLDCSSVFSCRGNSGRSVEDPRKTKDDPNNTPEDIRRPQTVAEILSVSVGRSKRRRWMTLPLRPLGHNLGVVSLQNPQKRRGVHRGLNKNGYWLNFGGGWAHLAADDPPKSWPALAAPSTTTPPRRLAPRHRSHRLRHPRRPQRWTGIKPAAPTPPASTPASPAVTPPPPDVEPVP